MIAPSAELVLMAAIAGLYLYDSALLLHCNEAVLVPGGRRGWTVGFGSPNLGIGGKELLVPSPLQIHRPLYRLSWQFESAGAAVQPWAPAPERFAALAPLLWVIAVALFVLLPLGLFTRVGELALLAALVLLYPGILAALAWTWRHRAEFGLSRRRFAGLAFESLVCPPFALNLVRHLAGNVQVREDLVSAARRLQGEEGWARTRRQLVKRLSNEIDAEDAGSERHGLLQQRRQMLATGG